MLTKIEIGSTFDNKYEILAELGSGANGTVFLAEETALSRKVAIKVLNIGAASVSRARFEREAKALNQLNHPNIIHVYRFAFLEENPFMVMELAEGISLRKLIDREKNLPCNLAVDIAIQVARALQAAHQHGIIHRDLKPENIVFDEQSKSVKVLDFGLCKHEMLSPNQQASLTETGLILGTVLYMSPEQCMGKELDVRTDIYSFACILYELITGTPPFTSENVARVGLMHISEPFPKLRELSPASGLPEELEQFILKCCQKDKSSRYSSFDEVMESLQSIKELNSKARFNTREAKSPLIFRLVKRITPKMYGAAAAVLVLAMISLASYLVLTDEGVELLAAEVQNSLTANDAIPLLTEGVHKLVRNKRNALASKVVEKSIHSKIFSKWPTLDKEGLLDAYIKEFLLIEDDEMVLNLRLQALEIAIDAARRNEKESKEQFAYATQISKELLKTDSNKAKQWKSILAVTQKLIGTYGVFRKTGYLYEMVLLSEALLKLEKGFSYDGLHTLAEQCYFTGECAFEASNDELCKKYCDHAVRVGRKIEFLNVLARTHVTLGMLAVRLRDIDEAKRQRDLAIEASKTLLLSTANTRRQQRLIESIKLGRPITSSEFEQKHPSEQRAPSVFAPFYNK